MIAPNDCGANMEYNQTDYMHFQNHVTYKTAPLDGRGYANAF